MKLVAMLRENKYPNYRKLLSVMRRLHTDAEYKISQKTVQRDVQFLISRYNAPIAFSNGKRGYYLTDQNWRFEVPQLDSDDMRAVVLGARLAETIMPEPLAGKIADAKDNLLCENMTGLAPNATLISLVATGARIPVNADIFREVFEAWQAHRGLSIKYSPSNGDKVSEMLIEPHVLAFHEGLWYIKAVIVSRDGDTLPERTIRTLALHRLKSAVLFPGRFEPDMELVKEVNEGGIFNFPLLDEVRLRFSGAAVSYALESYDPGLVDRESDGSVTVTLYDVIEFKIINLVLNEGGDVQVLFPPELAQKVISKAKKVIEKQR